MTDFKTSDRDVNRAIRSWLREDRHEDVSRVAGAVLDQVDTIPQRRTRWWPARRTPTMNKMLTIALGAAAVVVVALIGSQLIGSPDPGGTGAGTTSSPEPSIAEPTATPEPSPSVAADLDEGPYLFSPEGGITVAIPAPGWYASDDRIIVKNENSEPPDGAYLIGAWIGFDIHVPGDPCQWRSTWPDAPATTLDEIVASLASQASRDASEPVDVTIDGHPGKSITLHVPEDIGHSGGGFDCDEGKFCNFGDAADCQMWNAQGPGAIDEVWFVDQDGEIFAVSGAYYPETPADDVDELRAMLGSMTLGE